MNVYSVKLKLTFKRKCRNFLKTITFLEQEYYIIMKIQEYVQKYDPQNQFDVLINSYQQIEYAWKNELNIPEIDKKVINNIIVSGLGGSAISADLLRNFIADELTGTFIRLTGIIIYPNTQMKKHCLLPLLIQEILKKLFLH